MRYLYGDLTQASCQEDTLGLLQQVVDMAVEVLKLHLEMEDAVLGVQKEKDGLARSLEDIDQFRENLQETINTSFSDRSPDDVVSGIGQAVTATLQQHANDGKAAVSAKADSMVNEAQANIRRLAGATFEALKNFFMSGGLPTKASALRCVQDGLDYKAEAEIVDVTGISCSYELNTTNSAFFNAPKRFSDLVPGKLELPVGTKKAWLKKDPVSEMVRIDDATLVHIMDGDQFGEFKLATKAGADVQGVLVRVNKSPQVGIKVFKIGVGGQAQPVGAELFTKEHTEALSRFWTQAFVHVEGLYGSRENLASVSIEGKDVSTDGQFEAVIRQLVAYLAPIVREIDEHSLMKGELSLTLERDEEGKREVFFIRKDKLTQRIQELPRAQRKLFAPLGLEDDASPAKATPPRAAPSRTTPPPEGPSLKVEEKAAPPSIISEITPLKVSQLPELPKRKSAEEDANPIREVSDPKSAIREVLPPPPDPPESTLEIEEEEVTDIVRGVLLQEGPGSKDPSTDEDS